MLVFLFRRAFYGGIFLAALLGAQNAATTVTVDAAANRHAINPNIYGVAYGDATTLPDLNVPLNRYGGNNTSRYNWQVNGDNRGSDWYFESIGDASAAAGERGDTIFSISKIAGAQAMLTVPMIGWVARLGANRSKLASFSIAKYGAQTGNDWQWFPDAGNGVLSANGNNVAGNDMNDANVPADSTFQQGWIQHLVTTWGKAANGGVAYYILDNEHSIWFSTHRDVHPTGPAMDEIKSKVIDYSAKIKAVDPTALVVGPEEWGWSGYFYSGYDQQWGSQHGWSSLPDRVNHGGQDYLPWLLSQFKQSATSTGQRPLDVFSVHYYPQGGEFGNDTSTTMQLLRNESTRSLWDPNYVDRSWINDKVQLIPRLKSWVSSYYFPGTPVAITEYNWGAESHINGATTQADILGIFGREGLDMAARWTTPDPATPTYKAMKIYRNYDGNKSTFGDTSVSTTVANPDNLSAFAAVRSGDGALTLMVVDKVLSGTTPVTVALNNFSGTGAAQVYQLTAANSIQHLPDIPYTGASLGITAPPQSVTMLVLPKSNGPAVTMSVNRPVVNFGVSGSMVTAPQTIRVGFSGGRLGWTASSNQPNITVTPAAGNGQGSFVVTAAAGKNGVVTVSAPGAANSPLQVPVNVVSVIPGSPYGSFDTPVTNTVGSAGAIPVTGWALDNIEVSKVDIWREPLSGEAAQSNGLVYIGDAVFVDGARPDVEIANPSAPLNWRGGWGYMMLTNFLPPVAGSQGAGNGTYVLHAIAHNKAGNSADLGTKTITCDNAHASKPFGTIDTPGQGATVAGIVTNFGWALTQQPNKIAIDGSTITVMVDGQAVGHPAYNQYRSDIATAFPGYANSGGAVGFFMLDTTALADGVHTISWVVYDNAERGDGIGSRYFTVQNGAIGGVAEPAAEPVALGEDAGSVVTEELGRIEVHVGAATGHLLVGGDQRPLPIGSSLKGGIFYWQVGPGFLGEYQLLFERPGGDAMRVRITVHAKDSGQGSIGR
jgi:hypothetical protein